MKTQQFIKFLTVQVTLFFFFCACTKEEKVPLVSVRTKVSNFKSYIVDSALKKRMIVVTNKFSVLGNAALITEAGICWSEKREATIADSCSVLDSALLSAMKKNGRQWYDVFCKIAVESAVKVVRGYVKLSDGQLIYGSNNTIPRCIVDGEGTVYPTIQIGSYNWLTRDLRCTRFSNGELIDSLSVGQKSVLNAHDNGYDAMLYNWKTVTDQRGLAPHGWHIATDQEWKNLEQQTGMELLELDQIGWRGVDQGNALRDSSYQVWELPIDQFNAWPTNRSGFCARPTRMFMFDNSGYGDGDQINSSVRKVGFWWTASSQSDSEAWFRHLDFNHAKIFRAHAHKDYAYAVRCVKDY